MSATLSRTGHPAWCGVPTRRQVGVVHGRGRQVWVWKVRSTVSLKALWPSQQKVQAVIQQFVCCAHKKCTSHGRSGRPWNKTVAQRENVRASGEMCNWRERQARMWYNASVVPLPDNRSTMMEKAAGM